MNVTIQSGQRFGQDRTKRSKEARPLAVHHRSNVQKVAQQQSHELKYKLYASFPSPAGPRMEVLSHVATNQKMIRTSRMPSSTLLCGPNLDYACIV